MRKEAALQEKIQKRIIDILRNKKGAISTNEIAKAIDEPLIKTFVNLAYLHGRGIVWMYNHKNMMDWGLNDPCVGCGAFVPDNAKFCPGCGKSQIAKVNHPTIKN